MAELTIAMLISLQRRMIMADREIKKGHYLSVREELFGSGMKEMCDTRLGLLGLGAIGRKVAAVAELLGARVSYHDIERPGKSIEKEPPKGGLFWVTG